MCDASGCCVKEEPLPEEHKEQPEEPHHEPEHVETPEHVEEPHAPEEPHHEHETPEHEPETPEHIEPETPEEVHKEPETPAETPDEHAQEPHSPEEPHHEHETPEHKEPETPEEHIPETSEEEHKEPEHIEPQEPEEPHKEPEVLEPEQPKEPEIPEKEYACKEAGVFADDEDESSFFYCYLKSAHIKCAAGTVFINGVCNVKDPHYEEHISCAHEGYFRNPYDCSRFYRCYYNDAVERANAHLRIAFYSCSNSMVFDNTAQTCVLPAHTQSCENMQLV
jgi:hypothetical protein